MDPAGGCLRSEVMPYRAVQRYRRSTVVRPYQSSKADGAGPEDRADRARPVHRCIAHGLYIVRTGSGARHYNQGSIQWSTIRKANSAIR